MEVVLPIAKSKLIAYFSLAGIALAAFLWAPVWVNRDALPIDWFLWNGAHDGFGLVFQRFS